MSDPHDSTDRPRVLIVDDSDEDREICARLLRRGLDSVELLQASGGCLGLDLCRDRAPDCVLLDYRLPDMDGFEFVERLKSELEAPPPVIMLTGMLDETVALRAAQSGVVDYVPKRALDRHAIARAVLDAVEERPSALPRREGAA